MKGMTEVLYGGCPVFFEAVLFESVLKRPDDIYFQQNKGRGLLDEPNL